MLYPPRSSPARPSNYERNFLWGFVICATIFFSFIYMLIMDVIWDETPGTMWKTLVHDYHVLRFELDPHSTTFPRDDDWKGFKRRRCACTFRDVAEYVRPDDYGEEEGVKKSKELQKGIDAERGRSGTRCRCTYSNDEMKHELQHYDKVKPHA